MLLTKIVFIAFAVLASAEQCRPKSQQVQKFQAIVSRAQGPATGSSLYSNSTNHESSAQSGTGQSQGQGQGQGQGNSSSSSKSSAQSSAGSTSSLSDIDTVYQSSFTEYVFILSSHSQALPQDDLLSHAEC